jgi:REP element-mobilizing transposase RayT
MSHTFHQLLYHFVWSTKERQPLITPDFQFRLYEYLGGALKNVKGRPIQIGGVADHIHVCAMVSPDIAISEVIREIKVSSSKWVRKNFSIGNDFQWQEGYGAFSVSISNEDKVVDYIKNQETHHKKFDFRKEFLMLLKKHEVPIDEKYLWK